MLIIFLPWILFSQERNPNQQVVQDHYEYCDYNLYSIPAGILSLCEAEYGNGCGMGDGFTDFAVEEIENYGSGCDDLNGTGWSQYLDLGPAILYPGLTHDFTMKTGYDEQFATIWIDFNDDEDLTSDEIILFDFEMTESGQFYTASVTIPTDATPGLHYMRARTNWQASCDDPCNQYSYGETEDYYVLIGSAESGTVEGWVSELDGGTPIENATVTLDGQINYTATTSADGYYFIDYVFIGEYELNCNKTGFNQQDENITIEDEDALQKDFELTAPNIIVDPLEIEVDLSINGSEEQIVTIQNTGNGHLDWAASVQILGDNNEAQFDLQFQHPVAFGGGESGIETDGIHIYTTKWNTGDILKYDLEGNYIETLSISAVVRDLAYNGTYFYGSAGTYTVTEMDFENEEIISTFTAPTMVRAIAYNEDEDVFYANNYSSPIVKFDLAGTNLGEFDCGPEGENYYGFAYDPASAGGPFLWGYAQSGQSNNEIIQIQLPGGIETGFTLDVKDKLSGQVFNMAGGLFTHPNLVFGKWTLGGLVQNEWIWGLELADAETWLGISPNTGSMDPGTTEDIILDFDATDMEPGTYTAGILITTYPQVGNPVVEVILNVSGIDFLPCEILEETNCMDVHLTWSLCPAGSPMADSFYVYKNDIFLANTFDTAFSDLSVEPDVLNTYTVSAFYYGMESIPSETTEVEIPMPEDLEPTNLGVSTNGNVVILSFDTPEACVDPNGYNLYMDGNYLKSGTSNEFMVDWENHSYYVTAVYYFGESMPSNEIIFTGLEEVDQFNIKVYPNPAKNHIIIESGKSVQEIRLLDHSGKVLEIDHSGKNYIRMDVNDHPQGIYFLLIQTDETTYLQKIIIN